MNTLTEFHDIIEECSSWVVNLLTSSLSIIGIFVILGIKIGWFALIFMGASSLLIAANILFSDYNSGSQEMVARLKDKKMSYLS